MKSLIAVIKKEWMEQLRTGRLLILGILFILIGIMSPALAKLMPWVLEMMADSLAKSGMSVKSITVDALTSWEQYFKNLPMGALAFILIESSIFTREYQSGTMVLSLTKGLERYKIVVAKAILLAGLWSICFWMSFLVTYGYNEYFWDNSIAQNLIFSAVCWWLFGLWLVALTVLFSTIMRSNTGVLAGVGIVYLLAYIAEMFPQIEEYTPSGLTGGTLLISGASDTGSYAAAIVVAVVMCAVCIIISIPALNKKQI